MFILEFEEGALLASFTMNSSFALRCAPLRTPGVFEVQIATPPPRSLGIYALPPLTHNGEEIEVVSRVDMQENNTF